MKTLIAILAAVMLIGVASTANAVCDPGDLTTGATGTVDVTLIKTSFLCFTLNGLDSASTTIDASSVTIGDDYYSIDDIDIVIDASVPSPLFAYALYLNSEDATFTSDGGYTYIISGMNIYFESVSGGWFSRTAALPDMMENEIVSFIGSGYGMSDTFHVVFVPDAPWLSVPSDNYHETFYLILKAV